MITALHTLVFAEDPAAARAFFRDVLGFPGVDTGGGWLIFKTGPSELAVHPNGTEQSFDVSLVCDDLSTTMEELAAKGAEFASEVEETNWGHTVRLKVP